MTRKQAVLELEKHGFVVSVSSVRHVTIHASVTRHEIMGAPGTFVYPNPYSIVRRERKWLVAWQEDDVVGPSVQDFRTLRDAVRFVCKKGPRSDE
jgi:hypothetical protein